MIKKVVLFASLLAGAALGMYLYPRNYKARIVGVDTKQGQYIIFTDREVLRNEDSVWHLKFDSSDTQGAAKSLEGKTVVIRAYGFRVPVLSWYKNVVGLEQDGVPPR